jgi:hypothetical protein
MRKILVVLGLVAAGALGLPPTVAFAQSPYFFPHGHPPRGRTKFEHSWKPYHAPLNEAARDSQWLQRHYGEGHAYPHGHSAYSQLHHPTGKAGAPPIHVQP